VGTGDWGGEGKPKKLVVKGGEKNRWDLLVDTEKKKKELVNGWWEVQLSVLGGQRPNLTIRNGAGDEEKVKTRFRRKNN